MSDLKVELKRRNLPVSGSKPQLIERLKPFTESSSGNSTSNSNGPHVTHMGHILMDTPGPMTSDESSSQAKSPSSIVKDEPNSPRTDSPHSSEHDDPSSPPGMLKLLPRSNDGTKIYFLCAFQRDFRAISIRLRKTTHVGVFTTQFVFQETISSKSKGNG